MNWEEIGAIGQVLGSVAVFVTIGYLAMQVSHTRQEAQRNLAKVSSDTAQEILLAQLMHPSLNATYSKAYARLSVTLSPVLRMLMERAGLTEEEARLVNTHQMAWWQHRAAVIPNVAAMPSEGRISFEKATRNYFGDPLRRMWYEESKAGLHPESVRYVDNLLAQPA